MEPRSGTGKHIGWHRNRRLKQDEGKSEDIDHQTSTTNYTYDAIGNLKADGSMTINWNVYGKIGSITNSSGTISYVYDAAGNRISKATASKTTIYVRDGSGNVMSIYEKPAVGNLAQIETHLYGSGRLGILGAQTVAPQNGISLSGGYESATMSTFTRGEKIFELSNHLGNVLVTVSDKKLATDENSDGEIDYYIADVVSASDTYPFGMTMPGRKFNAGGYRYGFNGKENDNEVKREGNQQDYGMRIYDPRLGRFLSVDPLSKSYPNISPYPYAMNRPIDGIDLDGLEWIHYNVKFTINTKGEKIILDKSTVKDFRRLPESVLNQIHNTTSFYSKYSQGFGDKGRGILFTYEEYDGEGELISKKEEMEVVTGISRHGIYAGEGCVTKAGKLVTPGKYGNFDFGVMPIDMADAIAKLHDMLQDIPNYKGHSHEDYLNSDIVFLHLMINFKEKYENNQNYIDPFTNRKVSREQKVFVDNAITLFRIFVHSKAGKLKQNLKSGKISQSQYDKKTQLLNNSGLADAFPEPTPTDKVNIGSQ